MCASGMKRSLPCMDLISMQAPDDSNNPLLSLMGEHMKFWNDSVLAEESNSVSSTSSKKRRLSPLVSTATSEEVVTPATAALEDFLRFASAEDTSLDLDDSSYASYSSLESSATDSPLCVRSLGSYSFLSKSSNNCNVPSSIIDVTRGMAQISASS